MTVFTYTAVLNNSNDLVFVVNGQNQYVSKTVHPGCTVYISNADGSRNGAGSYVTVINNAGEYYIANYASVTDPDTNSAAALEAIINGYIGAGEGGTVTAAEINAALDLTPNKFVVTDNSGNLSTTDSPTVSGNFADNAFSIFNHTTPTKIAVFDASGISSSTTRTFTFQDQNGTLMLTSNPSVVSITNNTNATSINNGCLVLAGGLGIAKDTYMAGALGLSRSVVASTGGGNSAGILATLTTTGSSVNAVQMFNKFTIVHTATNTASNANSLNAVWGSINVTAASGTAAQTNSHIAEFTLTSAAAVVTRHIHYHALDAVVSGGGSLGTQYGVVIDRLTGGTNNYAFASFNTTDAVTNYERLRMGWSGNVYNITTDQGGTGVQRAITLSASALTFTGASTFTNAIASYNGDAVVSNGVASVVGYALASALSASVGATTLFTPSASGMYRMTAYLNTSVTQAGITVFVTSIYTDTVGAQSRAMSANGPTGVLSNYVMSLATHTGSADTLCATQTFFALTGNPIQFSTTVAGAITTGRYGYYIVLERLT